MSIIVEALNRLQDQVQMEETAAALIVPSADAPRGQARWLMMGIGFAALVSMAGWLWLARPHTVVANPPPPAVTQPATSVASPPPAGPSPAAPRSPEPEMATPTPARPPSGGYPAAARLRKTVVAAPSPIAFGGVQGEDTLSAKRGPVPSATTDPGSEPVPVEIQKSKRATAPDPAVGLFRLGVLYQQAGDHPRAIEQYRAILALNPRHVSALNNLAVSLRHLGELDNAVELLQRATAVDPTYDTAFTNLGVVRQLQERPAAAIEAHLQALAINPKNWESALNLGLLFWEAHNLERAREFFLKASSFRSNATASYYLGRIAERQGRPAEALLRYRQVVQERDGAQADLRAEAERRVQDLTGLARR